MIIKKVRRANQRLQSLEQKGYQKSSNAYNHIYKNIDRDYRTIGKINRKGNVRLTEDRRLLDTTNSWEKLKKSTEKFLSAKTSTVKGVELKYEKAYETYKDKYKNNDLSFERYIEFYEKAELRHNLLSELGSDRYNDLMDMTDEEISRLNDLYETGSDTKKNKLINKIITELDKPVSKSLSDTFKSTVGKAKVKTKSFTGKLKKLFRR